MLLKICNRHHLSFFVVPTKLKLLSLRSKRREKIAYATIPHYFSCVSVIVAAAATAAAAAN